MSESKSFDIRIPIQYGLIAGVVALSVSVIGMVDLFAQRYLIAGYLTLGQVILFFSACGTKLHSCRQSPSGKKRNLAFIWISGWLYIFPSACRTGLSIRGG